MFDLPDPEVTPKLCSVHVRWSPASYSALILMQTSRTCLKPSCSLSVTHPDCPILVRKNRYAARLGDMKRNMRKKQWQNTSFFPHLLLCPLQHKRI
jgi:hypothetical protein